MHLPSYKKYLPFTRGVMSLIIPINITFMISGVWHGAGWNFICFGIVTGIFMSIDSLWRWAKMPKIYSELAWALTMSAFLISLIFFRSPTVSKAITMISSLFSNNWSDLTKTFTAQLFPIFLFILFVVTHKFDDHRRIKIAVKKLRPEIILALILFCWVLAILVSQGNSGNFVYFDF